MQPRWILDVDDGVAAPFRAREKRRLWGSKAKPVFTKITLLTDHRDKKGTLFALAHWICIDKRKIQ
ncbi:hypothetical protein ALC56_11864 [Trachymyrmex septentrionalis]|uniref:Uncharacterized protein n=1 Tax=Trachymyrmex septentrionalis TaxID=34720 RepID=A0A195EZY6_9HYME|nr:hypothetical protein ALC56_11864 [Trachymyrmex septentrionalis]